MQQRPPAGQTSSSDIQPDGGQGEPLAAMLHGRGEPARRVRDLRSVALPWLAREENAQRGTMGARLERLRHQGDVSARLREELLLTAEQVSDCETFVLNAHSLLQRSAVEILTESEWDTLCGMVGRLRLDLPQQSAQLQSNLRQSVDGDVLPPEAEALSRELGQRLASAHRFLCQDNVGWDDAVRTVAAWFPIPAANLVSTTTRVGVQSRVVPGTALGSWFVNGYPSERSIAPFSAVRYRHVPDLAQTILKNEKDQVIFWGLRHGVVSARELGGDVLIALPDEELQPLVEELDLGGGGTEPLSQARVRQVRKHCAAIRASGVRAANSAIAIREASCEQRAKESAAAALVADRSKLRRALEGDTVNLRLFSLSLITRDDYTKWCDQRVAFAELDQQGSVELQVRDPDVEGAARKVVANVGVRQFVVWVGAEARNPWVRDLADQELVRLLGAQHAPGLQGDIRARLDAMNARLAGLSDRFVSMDQEYSRIVQEQGASCKQSRELNIKILELHAKRADVEKKALTLREAGQQLKAMWVQYQGLPAGIESHKKAAARLALIGRLMRETPVLICMSQRDFARQLDPEIKFLATVADRLHGHLPLVEEQMETWWEARSAFSPQ